MAEKKESAPKRKVPEYKIKLVSELANKIKNHSTLLLASTKSLPSAHFHEIKKNLRDKAEIKIARKSAIIRAIDATDKKGIADLKIYVQADVALFFSDMEPFELSSLLSDNQSASKAKTGDIASEDITVEPGPTSLVPGPAISELSGVGLKVSVESGKLAIKQPAVLVKKGEPVSSKVASVLSKLNILPMKVGFEPIAAYDSNSGKVYVGIKIDKMKTLEEMREAIRKGLGFAINVEYLAKETISFFIMKANAEEKAILNLVNKSSPTETVQTQDTNAKEDK